VAHRIILAAALGALAATLPATAALAHSGNPNYESLVEGVTPSIPGFSVVVLNGDDRLDAVNHSSQTITIDGYSKDPYVRMASDGTVSVNVRSPAYYLNNDRDGTGAVPDYADAKAAPEWKVVARDGRYEFHDHRMHWMQKNTPPQVKDASVRTKIVDWTVPLHADGADGAITGTLFWRGSSGGPPAGAFVVLALLLLVSAGTVILVRRRRRDGTDGAAREPVEEAW
jgi:hypothetical protein